MATPCPVRIYPDEPAIVAHDCPTREMTAAAHARKLEWFLVVVLAIVLGYRIITGSIVSPPGIEPWYWVALALLLVWGAAATVYARTLVAVTDSVGYVLGEDRHFVVALASLVAAAAFDPVRTPFLAMATISAALSFAAAYAVGHEKPSTRTAFLFLGFKAYLTGFAVFVTAFYVPGAAASACVLTLGAALALYRHSFLLPAPVLAGLVALSPVRVHHTAFVVVYACLFLRGIWYRVLTRDPDYGRNLFVRPVAVQR